MALNLRQPGTHVCTASPVLLCGKKNPHMQGEIPFHLPGIPGHNLYPSLRPATYYLEQYGAPAVCSINRLSQVECVRQTRSAPFGQCAVLQSTGDSLCV